MRTSLAKKILPLMLLLGLWAGGCQRTQGPLNTVSGRVTYQGAVVRGGTIVFVPDASKGEYGPIAHGKIHDDGTYQLMTGESAGVSAGWYRVTVASLITGISQVSHSFTFPQSAIPEKYRDPELSGLVCEVKAHQANSFDFNLK